MKKVILSLFGATLFAFAANADVITVSNNPNSPGQYTNLQQAIDNASEGDTILIHASFTSYGSVELKKRLVLIGEGALPEQQKTYGTTIHSITLKSDDNLPFQNNSSGTEIIGLNISGYLTIYQIQSSIDGDGALCGNFKFIRNKIASLSSSNGTGNSLNNLLINNVIGSMTVAFQNTLITNNIIFGNVTLYHAPPHTPGVDNIITNNIIHFSDNLGITFTSANALFMNNIIYNPSRKITFGGENNTYNNNLFFNPNWVSPFTLSDLTNGSGNTINGNIFQDAPEFVEIGGTVNVYDYNYTFPAAGPFADFHLDSSSPGKNYGTDGTDIGIYGGAYPWVDGSSTDSRFRYYTMPNQVPFVISMDILNTAIPENGTLNVQFNARTQE